jgi:CDP-diacylglycerol---serine O-phosphatidyltransferase
MSNPTEEQNEKRFAKGIYLLPNLFTTAGLFAGFYAIIAATKGLYTYSAITIFIAMIADGLDGRVARLTNTTSDFGAEYDSLSDMVAFGIAPAVVAYSWALHVFGKPGWLMAFFYTAAGALRLARFNVHVGDENQDPRFFSGLPIPAAAALVTSTMWIMHINLASGYFSEIVMAIVTIYAAAMMVSNIKFYSFKTFDFKGKVPFVAILAIVLIFMGIAVDPPSVLFVAFALFAISGPVYTFLESKKEKKAKKSKKKEPKE